MNNKKAKGMPFIASMMIVGLVPMIVITVVVALLSIMTLQTEMKDDAFSKLQIASEQLKQYFIYDIKANGFVDYEEYADHEYIESLQKEDVELTLFQGDTRFLTSLKNSSGGYNEGTQAAADIYAIVSGGKDYQGEKVTIGTKQYFVYYEPIYDGNGEFWGMSFAGVPEDNIEAAINAVVLIIILVAAGILVVLAIIIAIMSIVLTKSLKGLKENINSLSNGNLDSTFKANALIKEFNELSVTGDNLQSVLGEIIGKTKDISGELKVGADKVAELSDSSAQGANQISSAMEDLAQGATSMAQNVQSINEQVVEMGVAIDSIAENAVELENSSNNIKAANRDASEYINLVSDSSVKSVDAVKDISEQIADTNTAVNNIREAVDMIASVASQTNLLALNASIEAARAGEAGRGFSVVATEIKNLSEQTNESADHIKTIVAEIVDKSGKSVKLSAEVAEIISQEQKYIEDTQAKFQLLNNEIGASLEQIESIATKIETLNEAKISITESVSDLSAISEENAASNEEVSASVISIVEAIGDISENSKTTNVSADNLSETVAFFK